MATSYEDEEEASPLGGGTAPLFVSRRFEVMNGNSNEGYAKRGALLLSL